MTWFRVDDQWADSEKVDVISDVAARLWTICGTWCSKKKNLKHEGFVSRAALPTITKRRWTEEQLEAAIVDLVETSKVGVLHKHGLWEPCEGGWVFHDWEQYKPRDSDEPSLTPSEAASLAGQASAAARKERTGTAQPVKPQKLSNGSRTVLERQNPFDDAFDRTEPSNASRTLEPPDPDPDPVPVRSDQPDNSVSRSDRLRADSPAEHTADEARSVDDVKPQPSNALPPVASDPPKPATSAATQPSTTRPRAISRNDPMRRAMEQRSDLVGELFEAYRAESGLVGATLDGQRQALYLRLASEGVTVEQVTLAVRGAKLDPWARDKAKLSDAPILSSATQREKYIAMARDPPAPKGSRPPKQPSAAGGFGSAFLAAANGAKTNG